MRAPRGPKRFRASNGAVRRNCRFGDGQVRSHVGRSCWSARRRPRRLTRGRELQARRGAAGVSFLGQSLCCPPQWRQGRHCADQVSPSAGRSLRASDCFLSSGAVRLPLSRSRFLGIFGFTLSACPPLSVRRRWWALRD
eukprot:6212476-Pleurochrysis_carterae.AAC.2